MFTSSVLETLTQNLFLKKRPCRDAGVGAIALGLAMLERAERASHIDPPASSYAIMQRECPYCGENPGPGKDVTENLNLAPELENGQDLMRTKAGSAMLLKTH
jgi:hypothetical protein